MNDRVRRLLELLELNGRRVHVLLTRLTLCESTAEDLLQELFVRLSNSAAFDDAQDPTGYLIRAATNLAFEWRRKQSRTLKPQNFVEEPIAERSSVSEGLDYQETYDRVLRALDQVSDVQREIVILHRLEGHSYDEIALLIGKTPHQVRALCSKAVNQLQVLLNASKGNSTEEIR
ncbi:MAG: RNA polymerase sigma factor (sigma-70 family) [Pirellulaceae bacterium]|jgi:RNA polymerase sigma factor (sigma-70 family)